MKNHQLTFVSALYYSSYNDIIGGRGFNTEYYYPNIKALTCLGVPLIVYTHKHERANLISAFKDFKFEEYTIITIEFEEFLHHEYLITKKLHYIEELKIKKLINDRCHHIYWQKPIWLYQQSQINLYQSQYFLWVDIGLFHHGIFPDTMGGSERCKKYPDNFYYPENENSIFNPTMTESIERYLNKHHHILVSNINNKNKLDIETLKLEYKKQKQHIIAGVFGGNNEFLKQLSEAFILKLELIIHRNKLFMEEDILTSFFKQNIHLLEAIPFTHFHHSVKHKLNLCYIEEQPNQISFWQVFEYLLKN